MNIKIKDSELGKINLSKKPLKQITKLVSAMKKQRSLMQADVLKTKKITDLHSREDKKHKHIVETF